MLPVEFFLNNLLLPIAVTILILLFIFVLLKLSAPETRGEPPHVGVLTTKLREPQQELAAPQKTKMNSEKKGCLHGLGYLRKLPKSTQVPDECFGCEKMADCLLYKKSSEKIKG